MMGMRKLIVGRVLMLAFIVGFILVNYYDVENAINVYKFIMYPILLIGIISDLFGSDDAFEKLIDERESMGCPLWGAWKTFTLILFSVSMVWFGWFFMAGMYLFASAMSYGKYESYKNKPKKEPVSCKTAEHFYKNYKG